MRKLFYKVPEDSAYKGKAYLLEISKCYDLNSDLDTMDIAKMAARHYNTLQGFRVSKWPLIFTFHYAEDEPEIFRHLVDRRSKPHFIAINLREEEAA